MKRWGLFPLLFALVLLMGLFSMAAGQYETSLATVVRWAGQALGLGGTVTPEEEAVLSHIRLPRTIVAFLVGAALAVSGACLQGIFRNPLADPGIIGVSAGASFGAVIALALGLTSATLFALPACAFVGALLAVTLAVLLSLRGGRIPVLTLLLAGVVVGMFLAACTAALLTIMDTQKLQQYLFWTIGGLDYRRWEHVLLGLGPIVLGAGLMTLFARDLNILSLGEDQARSLGLAVGRARFLFLLLATMITATAVSISGTIGFVGLVVPHLLRLLTGSDHRRLIPASFLLGGAFLLFCDALGRSLFTDTEVRAGIMTALIGTPYFLYLLRRRSYSM